MNFFGSDIKFTVLMIFNAVVYFFLVYETISTYHNYKLVGTQSNFR